MTKTSNRDASKYVGLRIPFKGNNTFGERYGSEVYVAYSYGYHFPMYVYAWGEWYRNTDKYSPTTSKQQTQLHPGIEMEGRNTKELQNIIVEARSKSHDGLRVTSINA
jgi:hypothetical protein